MPDSGVGHWTTIEMKDKALCRKETEIVSVRRDCSLRHIFFAHHIRGRIP